jgi:predicted HAD superfamily phosphohydrolase
MNKRNLFLSIGALALITAFTVTYVSQDADVEPTAETTVLVPGSTTTQIESSEKVTTPAVVKSEENSSDDIQANESVSDAVSSETE